MERNRSKKIQISLVIIGIVLVAVLGSVFVNIGMGWFNSLERPMQWIPNILIPIVWTIIYLVFGVVLIVWVLKTGLPRNVIVWLIINGILNVLWCLLFFTLQLTFVGGIAIILNLIAGYVLFFNIMKYNLSYAIITSIYPVWLSIATVLNLALWILN